MRLLYVKGIPHWTDGEIVLPVIAGGEFTPTPIPGAMGPIDWSKIGGAKKGTTKSQQELDHFRRLRQISSLADLKLWSKDTRRDLKKLPLTDVLVELGKDGYQVLPTFFLQLQKELVNQEAEKGVSVSSLAQPSAASTRAYQAAEETSPSSAANSALALENLRFMHDQQQAAEAFQRQKELEQIQTENQLRRDKLSEAGALTRNFLDNQQKTRALIAELTGVDPIAATVASFGGVQRGTTPAQAAMTANKQFVNQAVPTVDENAAVPQIQSVIDQLNQNQAPVMPSIGFAQGGSMPTFGTNKTAILVGEEGTPPLAPGTEVQISDPNTGQVEVIPLTTQGGLGMQSGGGFDTDSIRGALAPFYGSLGFQGNVPTAQRGDFGFTFGPTTFGGRTIGGGETARMLGYRPRLIRDIVSGATYYTNPQGILQRIATPDVFKQAGFNQQDVLNVTGEELGGFGQIGADLNAPPPQIEAPMQRGQPLLSPPESGSIPLPNLPALASALRGLRRYLDPNIWTLISSIYGRAGLGTPQTALDTIQSVQRQYQPVGTQTRAGAARLG